MFISAAWMTAVQITVPHLLKSWLLCLIDTLCLPPFHFPFPPVILLHNQRNLYYFSILILFFFKYKADSLCLHHLVQDACGWFTGMWWSLQNYNINEWFVSSNRASQSLIPQRECLPLSQFMPTIVQKSQLTYSAGSHQRLVYTCIYITWVSRLLWHCIQMQLVITDWSLCCKSGWRQGPGFITAALTDGRGKHNVMRPGVGPRQPRRASGGNEGRQGGPTKPRMWWTLARFGLPGLGEAVPLKSTARPEERGLMGGASSMPEREAWGLALHMRDGGVEGSASSAYTPPRSTVCTPSISSPPLPAHWHALPPNQAPF